MNGSTTTFTMDLNTGLTHALSDGTNTYIYGNGRIAQVNGGTEYFLHCQPSYVSIHALNEESDSEGQKPQKDN